MFHRQLLLAAAATRLAACETTPAEPVAGDDYPVVVELSPTIDQQDFFWEDDRWVRFDTAPEAVDLVLVDGDGGRAGRPCLL
jgi:hypothetical protein